MNKNGTDDTKRELVPDKPHGGEIIIYQTDKAIRSLTSALRMKRYG